MTSTRAKIGRRVGRLAAVGAVALLLAGAAAGSAEARIPPWASNAGQYCAQNGGDPWLFEFAGFLLGVGCDYGDGDWEYDTQ